MSRSSHWLRPHPHADSPHFPPPYVCIPGYLARPKIRSSPAVHRDDRQNSPSFSWGSAWGFDLPHSTSSRQSLLTACPPSSLPTRNGGISHSLKFSSSRLPGWWVGGWVARSLYNRSAHTLSHVANPWQGQQRTRAKSWESFDAHATQSPSS